MILKRLKNLWNWSAITPFQVKKEDKLYYTDGNSGIYPWPKGEATIVDLEAKDPFDDTN